MAAPVAYAAASQLPYAGAYAPPPPPPPSGLAAVPTPVWIIVIGGGVFMLFKSGVFAFIGQAFDAAGSLVKDTGKAAGDIIGSTGDLGSKIIDRTGDSVVDPVGDIIGGSLSGVWSFIDNSFKGKTGFGQESSIKIFPLSIFG